MATWMARERSEQSNSQAYSSKMEICRPETEHSLSLTSKECLHMKSFNLIVYILNCDTFGNMEGKVIVNNQTVLFIKLS